MAVTCRVPTGTMPGPVNVRVENEGGWGTLEDGFTYFSPKFKSMHLNQQREHHRRYTSYNDWGWVS